MAKNRREWTKLVKAVPGSALLIRETGSAALHRNDHSPGAFSVRNGPSFSISDN
jgi:hypothetical protein